MYSEAPGNLPGTTTVQTHEDALDAKHDPWCLVGLSLLSKRKKPPGRALVAFCKNVHTDKKHTGHRSFVYLFMRGYIAACFLLRKVDAYKFHSSKKSCRS